MNKKFTWMTILLCGLVVVLASCAGVMTNPTASNFKDPVITLTSFEVPQYDGFWYYAKAVKPTKGDPDDRGAPLPMSFVFDIQNPNPYPVCLEGFQFTVAFDKEFDMVVVNNPDSNWIPAGQTDQVRATTMITARSGLLSLLVTGGFKLKAKGINAWQALEKWWTGVADYSTPVTVHEGSAVFKAGGVTKVVAFKAEFP